MKIEDKDIYIPMAKQINSLVMLGNSNNDNGWIKGIRYSLEYIGMTKNIRWTTIRIKNLSDYDEVVFIGIVFGVMSALREKLCLVEDYLVESVVRSYHYDKLTLHHDVRIQFCEQ